MVLLDWDEVSPHKDKIAELIRKHVSINHCCRVGWACKEILLPEHPGFDKNAKNIVQSNCLDKIAALVCESTKYVKEDANDNFKYDWNIRFNPAYKKKFFENPLVLVILGALFTFGSTWLLDRIKKDPKPPQLTMTKSLEQALLRDSVKTLIIHDTIYLPDSLFKQLIQRK